MQITKWIGTASWWVFVVARLVGEMGEPVAGTSRDFVGFPAGRRWMDRVHAAHRCDRDEERRHRRTECADADLADRTGSHGGCGSGAGRAQSPSARRRDRGRGAGRRRCTGPVGSLPPDWGRRRSATLVAVGIRPDTDRRGCSRSRYTARCVWESGRGRGAGRTRSGLDRRRIRLTGTSCSCRSATVWSRRQCRWLLVSCSAGPCLG